MYEEQIEDQLTEIESGSVKQRRVCTIASEEESKEQQTQHARLSKSSKDVLAQLPKKQKIIVSPVKAKRVLSPRPNNWFSHKLTDNNYPE